MAEYYGYAERDANAYVDWGKLGQNLTETVQEAYKIREDKKALLDKAMQDNYAELANSPTGENKDINGAVIQHSDNTKQYLLQVNKLLKAGVLKPKDYTLIMQNIKEDTKSVFDNAKNWQTAYAKILERNKNSTGSKAELDLAADVAAFGKFKDMQFMITPTTGRVSAAQFTNDGKGNITKGNTKSMQQLNVLMNQPIDKYKLTDKLSALQEKLGENKIATFTKARRGKNGEITEIEDKETKASFDAAKNGFISEVMANPFNVMSILTDYQGVIPGTTTPYKVSTNPTDKGKTDVIFYSDPDGDGSYTPEFSPAQRKAAEDFTTNQFLGLIDHKETKGAVAPIQDYHKSDGELSIEKQKQNGDVFGQNLANAIYGQDDATVNEGLRGIGGIGDIKYVRKQGATLFVYTDKNEPIVYDISGDNADDVFNQIVQGFQDNAGQNINLDAAEAKKRANQIYRERKYNKRSTIDAETTDRRPKATETEAGGGVDAGQYNKGKE